MLTALLASVSAVRLGAEKCTRGPGYWCESIANAKQCHSEAHCREKVWVGDHPLAKLTKPIPEQQPPKTVDNGNCALCEMIATEILGKLKDNATETEVIEAFEGLCEYAPKTESCKAFVDKYGKELWDEFVNNADVKTLCQLVGFCSDEFLKVLREGKVALLYLRGKARDIGCDACTAGMGLLKKEVLANEKAIEAQLEQTCSVLPVDKQECQQILDSVFEGAVDYFESYTAEQLCQMVGLCANLETLMGPGPVMFDQHVKLGKANDCQNGPAYWCLNAANAKECNMEEFCKEHGQPTVF